MRLSGAGSQVYKELTCDQLKLGSGVNLSTLQKYLNSGKGTWQYKEFEKNMGKKMIHEVKDRKGETGAFIEYEYNKMQISNEPVCYTGDIFPYEIPSCRLKN